VFDKEWSNVLVDVWESKGEEEGSLPRGHACAILSF